MVLIFLMIKISGIENIQEKTYSLLPMLIMFIRTLLSLLSLIWLIIWPSDSSRLVRLLLGWLSFIGNLYKMDSFVERTSLKEVNIDFFMGYVVTLDWIHFQYNMECTIHFAEERKHVRHDVLACVQRLAFNNRTW